MRKNRILTVFFTFFGIGFLPFAQGTWASLVSAVIYFFIPTKIDITLLAVLLVLSFSLIKKIKDIWEDDDPSSVVIDEVIGMMISLVNLPKEPGIFILAFLIFRAIDILKIPPVNFFDKMKSQYGVLLDDIVGGIMANIVVRFLTRFF